MSIQLTKSAFSALLQSPFALQLDQGTVSLTLVSCEQAKTEETMEGGRVPFSLLFESDHDIHLAQGIYSLVHSEAGSCELFLVPVGPRQLEAIFN